MSKLVWLTRLQVENFAAPAPHRLRKAPKPSYLGRMQCLFIDPPHYACSAFENSDNSLKHSEGPDMLYAGAELLRNPHAEGSLMDLLNPQGGIRLVRMACTQLIDAYLTAAAQSSLTAGMR